MRNMLSFSLMLSLCINTQNTAKKLNDIALYVGCHVAVHEADKLTVLLLVETLLRDSGYSHMHNCISLHINSLGLRY